MILQRIRNHALADMATAGPHSASGIEQLDMPHRNHRSAHVTLAEHPEPLVIAELELLRSDMLARSHAGVPTYFTQGASRCQVLVQTANGGAQMLIVQVHLQARSTVSQHVICFGELYRIDDAVGAI